MAEMVAGQLYRVGMTCRADNEHCELELLVVASSAEDAKAKLPWVYDFSSWNSFRVDYCATEPGRCAVMRMKFKRVEENAPDAVINRDEGSVGVWQKPGQQAGKKWQVVAKTVCFAKDESHAAKKLAERITGGSENVVWVSEELSVSSGFAQARDVSHFERATFVRG